MKSDFWGGLARAVGMLVPGAIVGAGYWYRQQHLSTAEHLMVLQIILLMLFVCIGYGIYRSQLYETFGRLALLCFVGWAACVAISRALSFFELTSGANLRLLNTGTALFFAWVLTWKVWGHTGGTELVAFIFGQSKPKETLP